MRHKIVDKVYPTFMQTARSFVINYSTFMPLAFKQIYTTNLCLLSMFYDNILVAT